MQQVTIPDPKAVDKLREEFEKYFADLRADAKREGYSVCKSEEWVRFVDHAKSIGKL